MKNNGLIEELVARFPELGAAAGDIQKAYETLSDCFEAGGKLLCAGNGGSCADAEHIVGELMKGFELPRPLTEEQSLSLTRAHARGRAVAAHLQRGLPALALTAGGALGTAFTNDVESGAEYVFAQQVFALGRKGDVFLGISTSGNSANVLNAAVAAKAVGMTTIGLTGRSGGELAGLSDICIKVPADGSRAVQEYHLPVYHAFCLMLERRFFGGEG